MHRITVAIHDDSIVLKLQDLANRLNKKPADVVLDLIKKVLGDDSDKPPLVFDRLDVAANSTIIDFPDREEAAEVTSVKPFAKVRDSHAHARKLRAEAWK